MIFVTRQIPTTAAIYGIVTRPTANRSVPLANIYRKTVRTIVSNSLCQLQRSGDTIWT